MTRPHGSRVDAEPEPVTGDREVAPDSLLDLWFALARRRWSTLVLTPTDPDRSVDEVAKALAEAGQSLSDHPVSALTSNALSPASVRALAALVKHIGDRASPVSGRADFLKRLNPPASWPGPVAENDEGGDAEEADEEQALDGEPEGGRSDEDRMQELEGAVGPVGQLIIAIPSVLSQPLGIGVARAADGVVLAVELGATRLEDVASTVKAIGRDHLVGSLLLRGAGDGRKRKG